MPGLGGERRALIPDSPGVTEAPSPPWGAVGAAGGSAGLGFSGNSSLCRKIPFLVFTGCSQAAAAQGFGGSLTPKGTWKGGNSTNPRAWSRGRPQQGLSRALFSHTMNFSQPQLVIKSCHEARRMLRVLGSSCPSLAPPAQGFTLLRHLGWCHPCPAPLRDTRHSSQDIPERAAPLRSPRMGVSITQEGSQPKVTQSQRENKFKSPRSSFWT